jgi:hypothetical protein
LGRGEREQIKKKIKNKKIKNINIFSEMNIEHPDRSNMSNNSACTTDDNEGKPETNICSTMVLTPPKKCNPADEVAKYHCVECDCGRCFKTQQQLKEHYRKEHEMLFQQIYPWPCEDCCFRAHSFGQLNTHRRSHAPEDESKKEMKPKKRPKLTHVCGMEGCTEMFETPKALKNHRIEIHIKLAEAMYPFACSHCTYRADQKGSVVTHENRHNRE